MIIDIEIKIELEQKKKDELKEFVVDGKDMSFVGDEFIKGDTEIRMFVNGREISTDL